MGAGVGRGRGEQRRGEWGRLSLNNRKKKILILLIFAPSLMSLTIGLSILFFNESGFSLLVVILYFCLTYCTQICVINFLLLKKKKRRRTSAEQSWLSVATSFLLTVLRKTQHSCRSPQAAEVQPSSSTPPGASDAPRPPPPTQMVPPGLGGRKQPPELYASYVYLSTSSSWNVMMWL